MMLNQGYHCLAVLSMTVFSATFTTSINQVAEPNSTDAPPFQGGGRNPDVVEKDSTTNVLESNAGWTYQADSNILWAKKHVSPSGAIIICATESGKLNFLNAADGAIRASYRLAPIPSLRNVLPMSDNRFVVTQYTSIAILDIANSPTEPAATSDLLTTPRFADDPEFLGRLHPGAVVNDDITVATSEGRAYRLSREAAQILNEWAIPAVARADIFSFRNSPALATNVDGEAKIYDIAPVSENQRQKTPINAPGSFLAKSFSDANVIIVYQTKLKRVAKTGLETVMFPTNWSTKAAWIVSLSEYEKNAGIAVLLAAQSAQRSEKDDESLPCGILACWQTDSPKPIWQRDVIIDDQTIVTTAGDFVFVQTATHFSAYHKADGKTMATGPIVACPLATARATGFAFEKRRLFGFPGE